MSRRFANQRVYISFKRTIYLRRMRNILVALAALAITATPAAAADITVTVRGDDGAPLPDAVVVVHPAGGTAGQPMRFSWPIVMTQQNIAFNPYVLIVPVGSTVAFPNKDKVRHHVYSFSATKKFELKLYGQQEERTVTFEKAGVVPLGCNIHDSMIGFIYVTDSPYSAKTNAAGEAVIRGVPAGSGQVSLWHPDMKARAPLDRALNVSGNMDLPLTLELRPPATRHRHPV
jgi:plastocyanin